MRIAVCGPLGAGCTETGQILSQRLGLRCISTSDLVRGIVANFKESFAEFELHVKSGEVDLDKMIASQLEDVLEAGDVVVEGRSGFLLLEDAKAFKVLLVASEDERARHIAEKRSIDMKEALEAVQGSDRERKHMVERLFRKDWLSPLKYDLVTNTHATDFEETANLILRALERHPLGGRRGQRSYEGLR